MVKHLPAHNEGALPWRATADDLEHQARGLRNRVSASLSLRDVRGILAVTRDTVIAAATTSQPVSARLRLLGGYAAGYAYRPPVLPVDSDDR
jgi:hypothetical protein